MFSSLFSGCGVCWVKDQAWGGDWPRVVGEIVGRSGCDGSLGRQLEWREGNNRGSMSPVGKTWFSLPPVSESSEEILSEAAILNL